MKEKLGGTKITISKYFIMFMLATGTVTTAAEIDMNSVKIEESYEDDNESRKTYTIKYKGKEYRIVALDYDRINLRDKDILLKVNELNSGSIIKTINGRGSIFFIDEDSPIYEVDGKEFEEALYFDSETNKVLSGLVCRDYIKTYTEEESTRTLEDALYDLYDEYEGEVIDYDGNNGAQCVDFIKMYLKECFGYEVKPCGNAIDYGNYNKYIENGLDEYLDFIPSSKIDDIRLGDILVFGENYSNYHNYGHVAVATGNVTEDGRYEVMEIGGKEPKTVRTNYNKLTNVIAVLRANEYALDNIVEYEDEYEYDEDELLEIGRRVVTYEDEDEEVIEFSEDEIKELKENASSYILEDKDKLRMVDLSKHNGNNVDFSILKDQVDGVILRAFDGWFINYETGEYTIDYKFLDYVNECEKYGIPYGCYIYSRATTPEMAATEAKILSEIISTYNLNLSFPVYYDIESNYRQPLLTKDGHRVDSVDFIKNYPDDVLDNFYNFAAILETNGYYTGIYAHDNILTHIDPTAENLSDYPIWITRYYTDSYTMDFDKYQLKELDYQGLNAIHQYSQVGSIPGVSGYVDISFCYVDYPQLFQDVRENKISNKKGIHF